MYKTFAEVDKDKMKSEALNFSTDMVLFFEKKSFVFFNIERQLIEATSLLLIGEL